MLFMYHAYQIYDNIWVWNHQQKHQHNTTVIYGGFIDEYMIDELSQYCNALLFVGQNDISVHAEDIQCILVELTFLKDIWQQV